MNNNDLWRNINLSEDDINYMLNQNIYNDNDLINIFNDDYNKNNHNKILEEYKSKIDKFFNDIKFNN